MEREQNTGFWCRGHPGCGHGSLWLKWRKGKGHCLELRSRNWADIAAGYPHDASLSLRMRTGNEMERTTQLQRPH